MLFRSVINYFQNLQEWIKQVVPIMKEDLQAAQREQQQAHNCPIWPQEFYLWTTYMLLLLHNTTCKSLACWQGLYTIKERVGPVNYCLWQLGKRATDKL